MIVQYAKVIGQQQEMIEKLQAGQFGASTNASSEQHRLLADDSIASMNQTESSAFGSELMAAAGMNDYGFIWRRAAGAAAANPYSLQVITSQQN